MGQSPQVLPGDLRRAEACGGARVGVGAWTTWGSGTELVEQGERLGTWGSGWGVSTPLGPLPHPPHLSSGSHCISEHLACLCVRSLCLALKDPGVPTLPPPALEVRTPTQKPSLGLGAPSPARPVRLAGQVGSEGL